MNKEVIDGPDDEAMQPLSSAEKTLVLCLSVGGIAFWVIAGWFIYIKVMS